MSTGKNLTTTGREAKKLNDICPSMYYKTLVDHNICSLVKPQVSIIFLHLRFHCFLLSSLHFPPCTIYKLDKSHVHLSFLKLLYEIYFKACIFHSTSTKRVKLHLFLLQIISSLTQLFTHSSEK